MTQVVHLNHIVLLFNVQINRLIPNFSIRDLWICVLALIKIEFGSNFYIIYSSVTDFSKPAKPTKAKIWSALSQHQSNNSSFQNEVVTHLMNRLNKDTRNNIWIIGVDRRNSLNSRRLTHVCTKRRYYLHTRNTEKEWLTTYEQMNNGKELFVCSCP